jgi:hypothetical protein
MDVSCLRLDSLNLRVDACKQFQPPAWAVPGNVAENGAALHVIKSGEVIDTLKIDDARLYTLFGRFPSCDDNGQGVPVRLEHPSVSRVHAAVLRGQDSTIFVIDLGSSHGTFVSGKRLEPFAVTALHDRSVLVFGQSTRRYIVRVFPKNVSRCIDAEEANTLLNCQVSYKQQSPAAAVEQEEVIMSTSLPKMERRVSFSCSAPEIIPAPSRLTTADGSTTPMSVMGGSPDISWFRKTLIVSSPRVPVHELDIGNHSQSSGRNKSDSLPSLQVNSGSDEDDETYGSLESLEMSPVLGTIDETKVVATDLGSAPVASAGAVRKSFYKRIPARLEAFAKKMRPENL